MKNNEQLTDSMFHIMAALTTPQHGYAIMNLIEETSKGNISIGPASMYTIIKKLLQNDWIYLYDDTDSRRKVYLLTQKGKTVLKVELTIRKLMIQLAERGMEDEV